MNVTLGASNLWGVCWSGPPAGLIKGTVAVLRRDDQKKLGELVRLLLEAGKWLSARAPAFIGGLLWKRLDGVVTPLFVSSTGQAVMETIQEASANVVKLLELSQLPSMDREAGVVTLSFAVRWIQHI